jgi:hypothetical protein
MAAMDLDCKDSPTPDRPDQGMAGFFGPEPDQLPPEEDPFDPDASTSVYEQYGFGGLRWHNYDLGCGVDAARNPEAVLGTTVANWTMNIPVGFAALVASLTDVAFHPTFLGVFDPLLTRVSTSLHESLFARWAPAVVAAVGLLVLIRARGMALSTATAAVGWAVFVVLVATALFRWPIESGRFADQTVTASLAAVVQGLHRDEQATDPATLVASSVQQSILYPAWLAGELGSTDSKTARQYGPGLFQAQTLSWREVHTIQSDPDQGQQIIDAKREQFGKLADKIRTEDPAAYEFLTGQRSDTRVAYAVLATLATTLALPFLLVSALMLLACYFVIRLAVMLFPAFATLGLFPTARFLVTGLFRTVAAALVNAVLFGIGAALTVILVGVILDPATGLPLWLSYVLLPLLSLIAWIILRPVRRVTSLAGHGTNPFADGASLGNAADKSKRIGTKTLSITGAALTAGTSAALGAMFSRRKQGRDDDAEHDPQPDPADPDRAEARPSEDDAEPPPPPPPPTDPPPPPTEPPRRARPHGGPPRRQMVGTGPQSETSRENGGVSVRSANPGTQSWTAEADRATGDERADNAHGTNASPGGVGLHRRFGASDLVALEPEWSDDEEVYRIYRPDQPDLDEWGDPITPGQGDTSASTGSSAEPPGRTSEDAT